MKALKQQSPTARRTAREKLDSLVSFGESDPDPRRLLSHRGGPAGGWVRVKKPNSSLSCGIGKGKMSMRKGLWGLCAAWGARRAWRSVLQGKEEVDQPHQRPLHIDKSVQPPEPANPRYPVQ